MGGCLSRAPRCLPYYCAVLPAALLFLILPLSRPAQRAADDAPELVKSDPKSGLELWRTALGPMWIPAPGIHVIRHLLWESTVEKVYHHPEVHVQPGDIVIDCGAHIGGFTRLALKAGASKVVAVEPEKGNLRAFRKNLEAELKSARVVLVEKGVWESAGKMSLHLSNVGDSHSFIVKPAGPGDQVLEMTTLDALAATLRLGRVDFIKMDIEGSERNALKGARSVLARWKPRLAVSSYHLPGDPAEICSLVWKVRPDYLVTAKDMIRAPHGATVPKVLFFR